MQIRFRVESLDGLAADIQSTVLAAVIYAFDVPLKKGGEYSVQAGDGIKGIRATWHFQSDTEGNSPKVIINRWKDEAWQAQNPGDPLTRCKVAFDAFFHMKKSLKERRGYDNFDTTKPSCRVENTRMAACLVGMGHPVIGWHWTDMGAAWHFDQTAATDAHLIHDEQLISKVPDCDVAYVKGAIFGHEAMLRELHDPKEFRVEHKGRIATIGKHIPQGKLDSLERIFYRK